MRENPKKVIALLAAMAAMPAANAQFQTGNPYSGNGNNGFGGTLGTGSFNLAQNGAAITLSFTKGSGSFNDPVVVFLNTVAGGVSSTSLLSDNSNNFQKAVSGNGNASTLTFSSGFTADYALVFDGANAALFNLTPNNSFVVVSNPVVTFASGAYSLGFSQGDVGLNPAQANNLDFVANVVSTSGFRSNEFLGTNTTVATNPGFSTPVVLGANNFDRFALAAVPEPASLALIGLALLPGAALFRRKK